MFDYPAFLREWNEKANLERLAYLTVQQKMTLEMLADKFGEESLHTVICNVAGSDYLQGRNKLSYGWKAHINWVIHPVNFEKVLKGLYN